MKKWIFIISGIIFILSALLILISKIIANNPQTWLSNLLLWVGIVLPSIIAFFAGFNDILQIIDRIISKEDIKKNNKDALRIYLNWLEKKYSRLNLRGIEERHQKIHLLSLDNIYISLAVSIDQDNEYGSGQKIIDMRELLGSSNRLAIVGGPGSGKTTFLHVITSTIARDLLSQNSRRTDQLLGINKNLPVPILISLSEYNRYRRQRDNLPGSSSTLRSFITSHLSRDELDLPESFFELLLDTPNKCILLLDGLDEVANEDERIIVREAVENLSDCSTIEKIIITSRAHAYYGQSRLIDFEQATVQPMKEEQVDLLIEKWTKAVYENVVEQRAEQDDLQSAIWHLETPRRRSKQLPLIDTPLMVTIVAIVHYNQHHLPEQRVELYEKCVDVLLSEKTDRPHEVRMELSQLGGVVDEKRQFLAYLAYYMMLEGEENGRSLSESQLRPLLRQKITELYREDSIEERLNAFIAAIRERGSLLFENNGAYSFIHLTFQEFLSAYYLAESMRSVDDILSSLTKNNRVADSWWRETILLLISYLGRKNSSTALQIIRQLTVQGSNTKNRLQIAVLAAEAFLELEQDHIYTKSKVCQRLQTLLTDKKSIVIGNIRNQAGSALARLGDFLPGTGNIIESKSKFMYPDIELCFIPSGSFEMGVDESAHLNESLDKPYWISRYPITNKQFECFVDANGYRQEEFWYIAQKNQFWKDGLAKGYNDTEGRDKPVTFPPPFLVQNNPVVGISWYEAVAFTIWLETIFPKLCNKWHVKLPSEAEWEKAARGGLMLPNQQIVKKIGQMLDAPDQNYLLSPNPVPKRTFAWGNAELNDNLANYGNTIGSTSSVGIFPKNESPYGVREMIGNVWEWTRSKEGYQYPYVPDERETISRVTNRTAIRLRGGSWWTDASRCTCSSRYGNFPYRGDYGIGFRIVLLPK